MINERAKTGINYGWIMITALSFTEMISWGILYYSFTVFMLPLQKEFGWTRVEITGALSVALLFSAISAVPVGHILDRKGPRLIMTLGSIGGTMLLLAWSQVGSLTSFYLIWAGIGVTMAAVFYEPAFAVIAKWFNQKRVRALTILTFGGGLASVIFIPFSEWLIREVGWRKAVVLLAAILALGTIPIHAGILRRRPEELNLQPDGADHKTVERAKVIAESSISRKVALRGANFWWVTSSFSLVTLAAVALTVHLIPYLVDRGYSTGFAATISGSVGLMALPGRLIFTPLGNYLPRKILAATLFSGQAMGIIVLLEVPNIYGVVLFVVLFGAGFGAITPTRAGLIAEIYGPAAYGSINGTLAMFVTLARAIAPVGAGAIYGQTKNYIPVFWTLIALSLGGGLLISFVHERKRS